MQDAYEFLKHSELVIERLVMSDDRTTCGKLLKDLGKGYPQTEAAVTCDNCRGHGYTEHHDPLSGCVECRGSGRKMQLLWPCDECGGGGGGFGLFCSRPFHTGSCRKCRGSGYYVVELAAPLVCPYCNGTGGDKRPVFYLCHTCEGVGEVKMWNPVLRRGALTR